MNKEPSKRKLRGLERVCKLFGSMQCGQTLMVWDYVKNAAVPESEMPMGSERWMASERARWSKSED